MQFTSVFAALLLSVSLSSAAVLPGGYEITERTHAVLMDKRTGLPVPGVSRRDGPSTADLINSCPKKASRRSVADGTLAKRLDGADTCSWSKTGNNGDPREVRTWFYKNSDRQEYQRNCPEDQPAGTIPSTANIQIDVTGSTTYTTSFKVSEELGLDIGIFSFTVDSSQTHTTETGSTDAGRMQIAPNQQGTLLGIQEVQPVTGTLQINYGNKQYDHYIWYVYGVNTDELQGDILPHQDIIGCDDPVPTDIQG